MALMMTCRRSARLSLMSKKNLGADISTTTTASSKNNNMREASSEIVSLLKERQHRLIEGVSEKLHPLPPFVSWDEWTTLGNVIMIAEEPSKDITRIPGEKYIPLRCDGTGFSKFIKQMAKEGIFTSGYSNDFANIRNRVAMKKF